MQINFKKLVLHNFLSFGHSELTFNDDGFIRVSGINQNPDDLAASNGSGKSSLWESIIWALTGDTIRGTKQVSNIYGEDGTYVELEFMIDKTQYHIVRSKDHKKYKTNILIEVNGKDCSGKGIRESEKLLQQYLPDITASLLGSVIILGQGLPQKFTNNTPSGRKEVLEKLSKSDFMIEDLKKRVASRKSELTETIRSLHDCIVADQSKQSMLTSQNEALSQKLQNIDKAELEKTVEETSTQLAQLDDIIEGTSLRIDELLLESAKLVQLESDTKEEAASKQSKIREEYEALLIQPRDTERSQYATIVNLKSQISQIDSIRDVCPTCGQKIIGVEKPDTTSLKEQLVDVQVGHTSIQQDIKTIEGERDSKIAEVREWCQAQLTGVQALQQDTNSTLSQFKNSLRISRDEQSQLRQQHDQASRSLTELEATIKNIHETISANQAEFNEINTRLMYNNNEQELQQQHLDVINKFETALKRDFRGYLLSTIIDYIAARTKEYCQVIFETDKIEFALDGNNIDISYMNKAYENLSGGEKQKIDLIVQFSIRDMLCNHLGFTSNILVLDEVFDGLDMVGCSRVLDVISGLSDVKNVYIVTHRKDLSIPTDKELVVVKAPNGISEIR